MSSGINAATFVKGFAPRRAYATVRVTNRDGTGGPLRPFRHVPGRYPGELHAEVSGGGLAVQFVPDDTITVDLPTETHVALAELVIHQEADGVYFGTIGSGDVNLGLIPSVTQFTWPARPATAQPQEQT